MREDWRLETGLFFEICLKSSIALIDPFSNVRNLDNRPFRVIEDVL